MTIRRDKPVSVRLTPVEVAALDDVARQRGITRHYLIRQVLRAVAELDTCGDAIALVREVMRSLRPHNTADP